MRTIRNIATGEELNISNVRSNNVGQIVTDYIVGTRFFNKYGKYMHEVYRTEEHVFLELNEGWTITETKRNKATKAKESHESHEEVKEVQHTTQEETTQENAPKEAKNELPTMDAAVNAFAALTPLFKGVEDNVTANIMAKVQPLLDRVPQQVTHIINVGEHKEEIKNEVFHPNFDAVCQRVALGHFVYLYGPTGSGKNVMAEQIARALGLDFYYQAHVTDRFELTGFIDANGNYHETEFFKAFTKGGLYMQDEADASDENAMVTLNSCANGYFAFPHGTFKMHPDFRCIAAGNTCGRGADEEYTSRRVLDASSLCRFIPRFHGYCKEVDMAAAQSDESLVTFFERLRAIKRSTGVAMILSPRQIKRIKSLSDCEPLPQILGDEIATYLTADDLAIVKDEILSDSKLNGNPYADEFMKVEKGMY